MHNDRGKHHDQEDEGAGNPSDDDHDSRGFESEEENAPDSWEGERAGGYEFLAAIWILEISPAKLTEGIAEEPGPGGKGRE